MNEEEERLDEDIEIFEVQLESEKSESDNQDGKPPKSKKTIAVTITAAILGVVAVFVVVFVCMVIHYVRKINYEPLNPDYTIAEMIEPETEDEENTLEDTPEDDVLAFQKEAEAALKELGLSLSDLPMDDVFNVLLVGTDNRIEGYTGRSDTVMLLSVNFRTKQITLTSFLRDLYVYIPQREVYDKLNSAYQYGGINLLMDTIQYNFSIRVDYYVSLDFFTFMQVVDVIGGLDIDVQEEELFWLNEYIHANNLLLNVYEYEDYIDEVDGSLIHLNGKQVLAYARFRYVGNGDFSRTERQRKVLNLAYDKLKHVNASQMVALLDTIFPQITTNIPESEIYTLLARVPEMSTYQIVNWGIPDKDYYYITIDNQSSLAIDFKKYVNRLYQTIYGNVVSLETDENTN